MTEDKKKSIDINAIEENDISRSELSNNNDDINKRKESNQNYLQIHYKIDEAIAQQQVPVQLQHHIKQQFKDQKEILQKHQNDITKNQETQTSQKFDSMIQNQNQRPVIIEDPVQVNQIYYPNLQNNLIYQPIYYVPYSQRVFHLSHQRTCCSPCLKFLMFVLFLIIGAGLTFFIIQKTRRKIQISNKNIIPPVKQLSKTSFVVTPLFEKQKQKTNILSKLPENNVSQIKQTSKTQKSIQHINRTILQPKINNKTYTQQTKQKPNKTQKFILKKGNNLSCPRNQLLVNGNCLSCEFGQQWFDLQCIKQPILYKKLHLLRRNDN